ncbi:hypothetical protein SAY87_002805 [Trapa incisa]|uniref:Uncharacterized protein n=1 Tax=Trapa incisa TaxID=236973 RepID=A0AAN7JUZ0_9MYRT|nr:hypothetical protein SAY87_002805 [Trapa incisa]
MVYQPDYNDRDRFLMTTSPDQLDIIRLPDHELDRLPPCRRSEILQVEGNGLSCTPADGGRYTQ